MCNGVFVFFVGGGGDLMDVFEGNGRIVPTEIGEVGRDASCEGLFTGVIVKDDGGVDLPSTGGHDAVYVCASCLVGTG